MIDMTLESEDNGWSCRNKLTVKHNGTVIIEEYDGGEPEDQSFYRDWKWVIPAIQKAYDLGVSDAQQDEPHD